MGATEAEHTAEPRGATTLAACDHAHGECVGDEGGACSVEQLARLGEGTNPANMETMQSRFAARLRGKYADINTKIRQYVSEDDIFGLGDGETPGDVRAAEDAASGNQEGTWSVEQLARTPSERSFKYLTAGERHARFVDWLDGIQEEEVIGVILSGEGRFIDRAYDRGARNARTFTRRANIKPPPDVDLSDHGPLKRRAVDARYTRAYNDARGISVDVSRDVSRVLTESYREGYGPARTARMMTDRVDAVGKHQATLLARTELMEAHNEASINTYQMANVEAVNIIPASDACNDCVALARGGPYRIKNASGLVPTHPQCRCVPAPAALST